MQCQIFVEIQLFKGVTGTKIFREQAFVNHQILRILNLQGGEKSSNQKQPKQKKNGRNFFHQKNIMCLEKREPNPHSPENIWKTRKTALTYALAAETSFLVQKQNLILAQAGLVSGLQFPRITSKKKLITALECTEPRWHAKSVADTFDTSSMTAQRLRVNVSA